MSCSQRGGLAAELHTTRHGGRCRAEERGDGCTGISLHCWLLLAGRDLCHTAGVVYDENVMIMHTKPNLMFVGAGSGATLLVGNQNVQDGLKMFHTAMLSVSGDALWCTGALR